MTECDSKDISKIVQSKVNLFIDKAFVVHGNKYDYSKVKIGKYRDKIEIICRVHGSFFQRIDSHLSGRGCSICSGNSKKTRADFIEKSKSIHGDKYDYSKSIYVNNETKLEIICHKHGSFFQQPNSHFNGSGCCKCYKLVAGGHSRTTYVKRCFLNHSGMANLYIIKCFDDSECFYKVGITSLSLKERFNKGTLPYDYDVILFACDEAGFIWDLEKSIHSMLLGFKYRPIKKFNGRFECFYDISDDVFKIVRNVEKSKQLHLIS
jgi:hypothetical protein